MITILSQSHTNYMATFTNFTNFTILHRHTWAWVKLGLSQLGCLKPWVRQPQLLVIPTVYLTRNKWEIRATILLGCGHHHTMTNCWHLKIGFWLSRMVWALVTYYASTNGQLVVGLLGFQTTMRLPQIPDTKHPRKCENLVSSGKIICTWCRFGSLWSPVQYWTDPALEDSLHSPAEAVSERRFSDTMILAPWPSKATWLLGTCLLSSWIKGKLAPETSHFMRVIMVSCSSHFNHFIRMETTSSWSNMPTISPSNLPLKVGKKPWLSGYDFPQAHTAWRCSNGAFLSQEARNSLRRASCPTNRKISSDT